MTLYNELDPFAAAWLRELIADRLIAPGAVDARDIRDIIPADLVGHRQVHLFAGIGVWSLALRLAGVPDDAEVWTASCPCQPFSAAGKRAGTADERHLWPAAFHLIRHCRPRVVMGEQVASTDGLAWLDLVLADLEAEGYTTRAVDMCAAGVGAPHIRQRLYWLAHAMPTGRAEGRPVAGDRQTSGGSGDGRLADAELQREGSGEPGVEGQPRLGRDRPAIDGDAGGLADAECGRLKELRERDGGTEGRGETVWAWHDALQCGQSERMADASADRPQGRVSGRTHARWQAIDGPSRCHGAACRPGPTNGLWRDPDWILCRDAKWRPVIAGSFPLAHAGAFRNRVAALRGAGNAIVVAQAAAFIRANIDLIPAAIERHEETT